MVELLGPDGTLDARVIAERQAMGAYAPDDTGQFCLGCIEDGVGIIPIRGYLHNGEYSWSWATAYCHIRDDIEAMEQMGVGRIVLDIDSPGGEVSGCYETARFIAEHLDEGLEIVSFASGDMCSAAYWLGSAAQEIVATPIGIIGCLGVMCVAYDDTKFLADWGLKQILVVSSQTPDKNPPPGTAKFLTQTQRMVDQTAAVMLAEIAAFRGVSLETVAADYGKGDVLVGEAALSAGLVDDIAESTADIETLKGSDDMAMRRNANHDDARGLDPERPLTAEQVRAAYPDIIKGFEAVARTEGQTAGAQSERERIASIHEVYVPPGIEVDRAAAIKDPNMTAGGFAQLVLAAVQKAPAKKAGAAPTDTFAQMFAEGARPLPVDDPDDGSGGGAGKFVVGGASYSLEAIKASAEAARDQRRRH